MGVKEGGDVGSGDQRMVAGEDEHGLGRFDQWQRGADRATGAVSLWLHDGLDFVGEASGDVAAGRDDRGDPASARLTGGKNRPGDHRPAADGMEHLRQARAHACAFARRHDEH